MVIKQHYYEVQGVMVNDGGVHTPHDRGAGTFFSFFSIVAFLLCCITAARFLVWSVSLLFPASGLPATAVHGVSFAFSVSLFIFIFALNPVLSRFESKSRSADKTEVVTTPIKYTILTAARLSPRVG